MSAEAIYIPGNPSLLGILDGLPKPLRRYREHAALLLHFVNMRRWNRKRDESSDYYSRLHSLVLRKYIPSRQVTTLRNYFAGHGVLELDGYSAGHYSIGYRIAGDYDGGLPMRFILTDERLIQKRQLWRESVISKKTPEMLELGERRKPITDSMRDTLDRLCLCSSAEQVERELQGKGIDPAHLHYSCSVIENHDHEGLFMDSFGWRVHSIVTHTTSELRPYFRFDGEPLGELDVRNAQPLILAIALRNPALCATYIGNAQHSAGSTAWRSALGILRDVPEREIQEFTRLCETGQFYESLMDGVKAISRENIKHSVYRDIFFGKIQQRGPVSDVFDSLWPRLSDMLRTLKKTFGYKIVARLLQRMESTVMIDGVCGRIVSEYPDIRFLTIHDAALAVVNRGDAIRRLIEAEFDRYGVQATVKTKNMSEKKNDTCLI